VASAERAQLVRVVLDVVIRVDDLVGAPEREAVRRHEHGDSTGFQHSGGLGERAVGVRHVLDRLHRQHRVEAARGEGQVAHVGHDGLAVLAAERPRIQIDADGLARREQVVGVPHAAAEIEHAAVTERRRHQRVGGHVPLPRRVESSRGARDAFAADPRGLLSASQGHASAGSLQHGR
jgi:hypothetical protein